MHLKSSFFFILTIFTTFSCRLSKNLELTNLSLNVTRSNSPIVLSGNEYFLCECQIDSQTKMIQSQKLNSLNDGIFFTFENVSLQELSKIEVKVYYCSESISYLKYVGSVNKDIKINNNMLSIELKEYKKEEKGDFAFVQGAKIKILDDTFETDIGDQHLRTVFIKERELDIKDFYITKNVVSVKDYNEIFPDDQDNYERSRPDNYSKSFSGFYEAFFYCNARSIKENLKPCYSLCINNKWETDPTKWGEKPTYNSKNLIYWMSIDCDFNANGYRLPTEVEWEYAMREGITMNTKNTINVEDIDQWGYDEENETSYLIQKGTPNKLGIIHNTLSYECIWDLEQDFIYPDTPINGITIPYDFLKYYQLLNGQQPIINYVLRGGSLDIRFYSGLPIYVTSNTYLRLVRTKID